MKDGEHRSVPNGVQELADVPRSGQRPSLRLAVPDHRRDDQIRIVERRAAGVRQDVSQFSAFVDRTWCFRRAVAADAARERKLLEPLMQATFVFDLYRLANGIGPFEIPRTENARRTMPRTRHETHVETELLDQPVQVDIDESQTGA